MFQGSLRISPVYTWITSVFSTVHNFLLIPSVMSTYGVGLQLSSHFDFVRVFSLLYPSRRPRFSLFSSYIWYTNLGSHLVLVHPPFTKFNLNGIYISGVYDFKEEISHLSITLKPHLHPWPPNCFVKEKSRRSWRSFEDQIGIRKYEFFDSRSIHWLNKCKYN